MPRKPRVKWDQVDWTKTNMEIAWQHNIASQGYVAWKRRQIKKPVSPRAKPSWGKAKNFASPRR